MDDVCELKKFANQLRRSALSMALSAGRSGCHVGGGFSAIEIFAVLFGSVLRVDAKNPMDEKRDRFIASKAHCILPHFSALAIKGFLPEPELQSFHADGGLLAGHPWKVENGLEFSGGSLGMGLSLGVGVALCARRRNLAYRTYVLLGDGEINEGSVWEAFASASQFRLDNLVAIVDYNHMQFDGKSETVMSMEPLQDKLSAFGWSVRRVNGHDVGALYDAFRAPHEGKPLVIIADTVKAHGIPGLEDKAESHHAVLTQEMYDAVMKDIEEGKYD